MVTSVTVSSLSNQGLTGSSKLAGIGLPSGYYSCVPPVREQGVLPGLRVYGEPSPAAAMLIDPQVRHRGRGVVQHRVRGGGERLVRGRPGDPGVPGRFRRGDPPPGDLGAGLLP